MNTIHHAGAPTPDQLSLPGLDTDSCLFQPDTSRSERGEPLDCALFLAIVTQPKETLRLTREVTTLRQRHGLTGASLSPERRHIPLNAIRCHSQRIPQDVVDAAIAAAAPVIAPTLPIVFDRVLSFPASRALVLRCGAASDAGIARLRQMLALEWRRVRLRSQQSSTPHMTLLYDTKLVAPHANEPIHWTVTRFALVLSHRSKAHHEWIAQWDLEMPI